MRPTIFLLALAACSDEDPTTTDESVYCEDTPSELAIDEVSPLGFAPEAILAFAEGSFANALVYSDDESSTPLTLGVASLGSAWMVDSEAVYPEGNQTDIGLYCADYVAIDVTFTFATDDGAFAESWTAELTAEIDDMAFIHLDLDQDTLAGTYRFDQRDPSSYDELSHFLWTEFNPSNRTGELTAQISGQDDCSGPDCAAWAESVPVAYWNQTGG